MFVIDEKRVSLRSPNLRREQMIESTQFMAEQVTLPLACKGLVLLGGENGFWG